MDIFLDTIWIDTNLTFCKSWQSEIVNGMVETENTSNRVSVIHITLMDRFLSRCQLAYKSGSTVSDFHR